MISVDAFLEMFEYNYWARDRQLRACATLSREEFLRPMGSSFSSLRDTLGHLVGAETVWLDRWRERYPETMPEIEAYYKELLRKTGPDQLNTPPAVAERWHAVELDLREFLATLSKEALLSPVTYVNLKGKAWSYPLWRTLLHVVNHQTYHRGQVATLLRQLGVQPPQIDYLVALDLDFQR